MHFAVRVLHWLITPINFGLQHLICRYERLVIVRQLVKVNPEDLVRVLRLLDVVHQLIQFTEGNVLFPTKSQQRLRHLVLRGGPFTVGRVCRKFEFLRQSVVVGPLLVFQIVF
jgi:hypothetical protein